MLELVRIALTDRRGLWRGNQLKPLDQWTADEAALLEGFEIVIKNAAAGDGHTDTVHKVHLAKKTPALELLCKKLQLLIERHEVKGTLTLEHLIALSRRDDDPDRGA